MKAILIDDEQLALDYLEHQLLSIEDLQVIGKFTDPFVGRQAIIESDVDIVFLDIHIPELNGIELAEQLLEGNPKVDVIFVTSYDEYAIKAFELNALDYLLKPVKQQRLMNTMQRIKSSRETSSSVIQSHEKIQMNMFQHVSLSTQGQMLPLSWRTAKVEHLFLYLIQHRGQAVSKQELMELLWPEVDQDKALKQLYTTIYHIRKTLEPFESYFSISNTTTGYLLTLEQVELDVEQFEQFIHAQLPLNVDTIQEYKHVINMSSGEYLLGYDYVWVESERQRLQLLWITMALKMVEWYYANHMLEEALVLSLDINRRYPFDEDTYFYLMKIFARLGKDLSVHQQYNKLQKLLLEEFQTTPNANVMSWYKDWMKTE